MGTAEPDSTPAGRRGGAGDAAGCTAGDGTAEPVSTPIIGPARLSDAGGLCGGAGGVAGGAPAGRAGRVAPSVAPLRRNGVWGPRGQALGRAKGFESSGFDKAWVRFRRSLAHRGGLGRMCGEARRNSPSLTV